MATAEETKEGESKEAAPAPATGKSKKKLVIVIAIVVILLIAGGVTAAILSSGDQTKSLAADAATENAELVEEGAGEEEVIDDALESLGAIFPLETFLVNLTGGGFIKIQVQVEFVGRSVSKRFQIKLVPIRDGIIQVLSSRRREEILNKEGKENLKSELITLINETLGRNDIKNMYFTNFVVQ
jgi:flagellar FliL protein